MREWVVVGEVVVVVIVLVTVAAALEPESCRGYEGGPNCDEPWGSCGSRDSGGSEERLMPGTRVPSLP